MPRNFLPFLLSLLALLEPFSQGADLVLTDGKIYRGFQMTKQEPDGIRIIHEAGSAKIPYELLPPDVRARLQFDEAKAAEFRQVGAEAKADLIAKRREAVAKQRADEDARAHQERMTPKLTSSSSVKKWWIANLPWLSGLDAQDTLKTKYPRFMQGLIEQGYFDLESEMVAVSWNMREFQRVGNTAQADALLLERDQLRARISERDKQRTEAELQRQALAAKQAEVNAWQDIANSIDNLSFRLMQGNTVIILGR